MLPVGDDAQDGHRQRVADLAQQRDQVVLGRAKQAPGQQHLAGQALADHPQHLVAHVGLHAVERQHHAALAPELLAAVGVGQPQRHQLLVALEQVRDRSLGDANASRRKFLVDLRDAPVLGIAERRPAR